MGVSCPWSVTTVWILNLCKCLAYKCQALWVVLAVHYPFIVSNRNDVRDGWDGWCGCGVGVVGVCYSVFIL